MKLKQSTTKFKQKEILSRLRIDFCLLSLSVHFNCVWLPQTWYVPELGGILFWKTMAAHLQPRRPFLPPFTARLSLTFMSNTAIRRRGRLPVRYASLGNHGRAPHAATRSRHMSDVFPFGLLSATAAAAGMPAIYRTAFSQLLQSAAAFIWRRWEFICKLPPRLKHQILFVLLLLLQQPLNSGSTYQLWNRHRGTTAVRDLSSSHFVRSAGILA